MSRVMRNRLELMSEYKSTVLTLVGCLFGVGVSGIGVVSMIWGSNQAFGIFLLGVALVYFPPVNAFVKYMTGLSIPDFVKIGLAIFIICLIIGMGDLSENIYRMFMDLNTPS